MKINHDKQSLVGVSFFMTSFYGTRHRDIMDVRQDFDHQSDNDDNADEDDNDDRDDDR